MLSYARATSCVSYYTGFLSCLARESSPIYCMGHLQLRTNYLEILSYPMASIHVRLYSKTIHIHKHVPGTWGKTANNPSYMQAELKKITIGLWYVNFDRCYIWLYLRQIIHMHIQHMTSWCVLIVVSRNKKSCLGSDTHVALGVGYTPWLSHREVTKYMYRSYM